MLEMRETKSDTNIHLMVKVVHIVDIALERDKSFSESFKCFLEESPRIHKKVLPNITLPTCKVGNEYRANDRYWSYFMNVQHSQYANGILLCLSIPLREPSPQGDDWVTVHHDKLSYFWFYGETYDKALQAGMEYLIEYSNQQLEFLSSPFRSTFSQAKKIKKAASTQGSKDSIKYSGGTIRSYYLRMLHKLNMFFLRFEKH